MIQYQIPRTKYISYVERERVNAKGLYQYGSGITFIGILQVRGTLLYKGRVLLRDAMEAMQHRRGNEQYGSGITFIGILQVSDTLLYKGRVLLHDAREAMQHRRGNEQS